MTKGLRSTKDLKKICISKFYHNIWEKLKELGLWLNSKLNFKIEEFWVEKSKKRLIETILSCKSLLTTKWIIA